MERRKNGRNGIVDIFRLLYALVIMTGHSVTVGVISPFPFEPVGILVEFFFFLSGYFTCVEFEKKREADVTDYMHNGLEYTVKKFKVFVPYLAISVIFSYSLVIISVFKNWGVL